MSPDEHSAALPVALSDIEKAAARLSGVAVQTPILESHRINDLTGCRVLFKAEVLQKTGSFKFRGAYNRLSKLSTAEKSRGVVAFSSGNHAQGVAHAAMLLGIPATIVMPADAPRIKIENTRGDGATVIPYNRADANRAEIADKIVAETGATLVPPYNDPDIIAGQGTSGLEFTAQAESINTGLDALLVPCSGGGLVAGCATALAARMPGCNVYSVEPADFDDTARSLAAGQRLEINAGQSSICDALLVESPGSLTFQVNNRLLTGGLTASDSTVGNAMRMLAQELKLVVEASGAIAFAAILEGNCELEGKTVGVMLTGGNVDLKTYREIIGSD
ncbi:MAG: threonine/serine dehydratase [Proteobacteria bacterium]|nr:threonine/serine dehydratase [Pseudomonadota bacterium]